MKNKILKISLAFLSIFFTSCLEDDKNPLDPSGSVNIIEFANISIPASGQNAVYPVFVTSFTFAPTAALDVVLSYSGPNENNKDIQVTLEIDPLAVDAYNDQNDTDYLTLDPSQFSIASMTVTIPKGKTKVTLPVTIFPEEFDLSKNYVLPLKIASSSSGIISKNWSTALFATVVKNKFDGEYRILTGSMVDVVAPNLVGYYPKNSIYLTTVNGNTVDYSDNEFGANHVIYTGTGLSQYGSFAARFSFDETTGDVVSVVNRFGQPSSNGRSGRLDTSPGAVNKMFFKPDGSPDRLEVWYIMVQGGDRTFWKEIFTYVGERP